MFAWILSPAFLRPNWTRHIEEQPDRVRRCASMEGNVLWASLELGLMDERLQVLADRLGRLQWPDGGWNCDVRPQARQSSFVETVLGLRGLAAWVQATGDKTAAQTLERGVELLLEHHLLFHRSGALIVPNWGPRPDKILFPIRFFDVLLVLELMADIGCVDDSRCNRALDLLLSKRTGDGGFPMEVRRPGPQARSAAIAPSLNGGLVGRPDKPLGDHPRPPCARSRWSPTVIWGLVPPKDAAATGRGVGWWAGREAANHRGQRV